MIFRMINTYSCKRRIENSGLKTDELQIRQDANIRPVEFAIRQKRVSAFEMQKIKNEYINQINNHQ